MRKEIKISGFGGQGTVLAGYILGKCCSLHQGLEAVMTQAYGPEARGGASSSNIVISDEPIDYPFVQEADILVALSQEAYTKFRPLAKPDALCLIDEDLVVPFDDDQPMKIPATKLAEDLGRRIVANVVMLGFFTALVVKEKTIPLNIKAFETGYAYAKQSEIDLRPEPTP
jgi:2-oxoglutarate ferredoxin oxidoreductase subunit gamma